MLKYFMILIKLI